MTQGSESTSAQRLALGVNLEYNLTDGHPRRPPFSNEQEVIARLPEFFEMAAELPVPEIENEFVSEYSLFTGQTLRPNASFVFSSASNALICTAMLIRQATRSENANNLTAGVITPVFDNLPAILEGFGMKVEALTEKTFTDKATLQSSVAGKEVVLLVSPNNPTGFTIDSDQLTMVATTCESNDATLIVDSCFRMHKSESQFDTSKILDETGVSYAIINDTGKLWALHETKAGILTVSDDLRHPARKAHDIMQLSVSSVTMLMLTELMRLGGDLPDIKASVRANRLLLQEALAANDDAALKYPDQESGLPLELLEFSKDVHHLDGRRSSRLGAAMIAHVSGVRTMPVTDFMIDFTEGKSQDPGMVRVTLSRSGEHFKEAAQRMGRVTAAQLTRTVLDRYL